MKHPLSRPDGYVHLGWFPLPAVKESVISGAPDFLQGLKLLFLSDVHLRDGVKDEKLEALISLIEAQEADMILLGGDYGEQADQCERFFRALSRVKPRLGCYAVPGNNDSEAFPEAKVLQQKLQALGVTLLVNETVSPLPGLEIGGLDDHKHGSPQSEGIFSQDSAYRILLSHFPIRPKCRTNLMLSGHTHGGQFNFLGLTPYVTGFEKEFQMEAVSGPRIFPWGQLLVSKGIGMSKLPLRLFVQAEIQLLKFARGY